MADEINKAGSSKPIIPKLGPEDIGTKPRTKGPSDIPPVDTTTGKSPIPSTTPAAEAPRIPTPEGTAPTEDEKKTAIKFLQEYIKQLKESVFIDAGNKSALLNMFKNSSAKELLPEDLAKMAEILGDKSPEEQATLLELALMKYAIGPDGNFTQKFLNLLKNPKIEVPADKSKQEEAFSFFTLMLLLNKLSSNERDALSKGIQLEQANIQVSFKHQVDNIKQKMWTEIAVTALTVIGGGISLKGASLGGLYSTDILAQKWSTFGKAISEISSTAGRAANVGADVTEKELAAEQQKLTFNKDALSQSKSLMTEQINAASQTNDEVIRSTTATISKNIGNI